MHMKTTVEIDEHKLNRVMELCQISTRREAIDRALTELERQASFKQVLSRKWDPAILRDAIDPAYDVLELRNQETPGGNPG
jgi:hypothetical protein